jgi:CBS domain containing-hemolysin-like protein
MTAATVAATFGGAELGMTLAIVGLLFILIFFAVAETSLNRISRVKAHAIDMSLQTKSSAALLRLVGAPERFINPVLVTVTFCQTGQAFLTSLLAARLFGATGVAVGFVLNVVVFFVLSEAMPKTWAVLRAERAALATARVTDGIVSFRPLRMVSQALIGLTNVLLPGKGLKEGPFVSEQELLGIVGAAAEDDVIEHEERQLIESIIEFGDTVAREIMVPRPDMVIVDHAATISQALDQAIEHGFSRLPVMGDEEGDIVGLAFTKDLVKVERGGDGGRRVVEVMRPVRFVPENKPVARLMREMQAEKFHLALIVDEYGGIAGLVTLEDCLEELVGEIVDEYDEDETAVVRLDDGGFDVDGGYGVSDLNDLLGLQVPDEDFDTLAGFVFGVLEHVPEPGEVITHDGWSFEVIEMEGRRIRRVRIRPVVEGAQTVASDETAESSS